jgi:RNA recognition motif-containing protein
MSRYFSGGKRARETNRDLKKRQKEARLSRNREMRARGIDPDTNAPAAPALPEVKLEDVVISVAPRSRPVDFGPTKLYVGGFGPMTTVADLRTSFGRFGELVDVVIVPNRATSQSRCFGYVSFQSSGAADDAIKGMNGVEVDGHPLRVNRAESRSGRS